MYLKVRDPFLTLALPARCCGRSLLAPHPCGASAGEAPSRVGVSVAAPRSAATVDAAPSAHPRRRAGGVDAHAAGVAAVRIDTESAAAEEALAVAAAAEKSAHASATSELRSTISVLESRLSGTSAAYEQRIAMLTTQLEERNAHIALQRHSREGAHALFSRFEEEARAMHVEAAAATERSTRLAQQLSVAQDTLAKVEGVASAAAEERAVREFLSPAAPLGADAAAAPTLEALAALSDDADGAPLSGALHGLGDASRARFVDRDRREQKRAMAKLRKANARLEAEIAPLRLNARRFALHKRCLSDAMLKVEKLERISRKSARELAETSLSLAEVRERCTNAEAELAAERSTRQSLAHERETMELSIRELRELLRRAHRERHCDDLIKMVMARRRALARGDAAPGGFESHENAPDFGGRIPPATLPHAVERMLLELQREASGPCLDPRKGTRLVGQLRHAMLRMDAQRRGCVAAEDSVIERLVAFLEEDGTLALPRTEAGGVMRRQHLSLTDAGQCSFI